MVGMTTAHEQPSFLGSSSMSCIEAQASSSGSIVDRAHKEESAGLRSKVSVIKTLICLGVVVITIGVSCGVALHRRDSHWYQQQQGDEMVEPHKTTKPTLVPTLRPSQEQVTSLSVHDETSTDESSTANTITEYDISGESTGDLRLSVAQITFGENHHLFGYIGQSLTIPWNGNDRYIVALQSSFHDHLPLADEAARIVLIDTLNDAYTTEVLDETRAWNMQQGTMLFWNPEAVDTQFFFNDRDIETNKVFTVLYDIALRKRVREYRFDTPVANGGVCPNGGFFYAINYARMARLRPVTGYPDTYDWTVGDRAPENDGIWKVDIKSGGKELLTSFQDISKLLEEVEDTPRRASLYINHALSSRDCTRIYFFCRGNFLGKEQAVNEAFTMKSDGSDLKRVGYIGGHPEWYDETVLFGKKRGNVVKYNIELDETDSVLGKFDDPRGDLSLSANGKMFVNGWEDSDDNSLRYHFVRLTDGTEIKSLPMDRGPHNGGDVRIDAAPRWNRAGNKVLIPGWVDGTRQLHVITVKGAVEGTADDDINAW